MATSKRIEDLKAYCLQWNEYLENMTKRRDEFLKWKSEGLSHTDEKGIDVLSEMIHEADAAVLNLKKITLRMESIRDRAIGGEEI